MRALALDRKEYKRDGPTLEANNIDKEEEFQYTVQNIKFETQSHLSLYSTVNQIALNLKMYESTSTILLLLQASTVRMLAIQQFFLLRVSFSQQLETTLLRLSPNQVLRFHSHWILLRPGSHFPMIFLYIIFCKGSISIEFSLYEPSTRVFWPSWWT